MMEKKVTESSREAWRLNSLVQTGIRMGGEYFPEKAKEFGSKKVELKINKGDLQLIQVLNRTVVNSTYGRWAERVSPNFDISLSQWNDFAESQSLACMELERVTGDVFFKTNPPTKPEDWENFNEAETKIEISFKTARSIIQVLVPVMDILDSEASGLTLDKDRDAYYEHVLDKDRRLKCIGNLLSQMVDQKLPVRLDKLSSIKDRQRINEPDAKRAKFLLQETR